MSTASLHLKKTTFVIHITKVVYEFAVKKDKVLLVMFLILDTYS